MSSSSRSWFSARPETSHSRGRSPSTRSSPAYHPTSTRIHTEHLDAEIDSMRDKMVNTWSLSDRGTNGCAVIGVVASSQVARGLRKAVGAVGSMRGSEHGSATRSKEPRRFFKALRASNRSSKEKPPMPLDVVTYDDLQTAIDEFEGEKDCTELFIIVHSTVRRIFFDVRGNSIDHLSVLQQRRIHGHNPSSTSIIAGSSTYAGVRLDEIGAEFPKVFSISPEGVGISLDPSTPKSPFNNPQAWSGPAPRFMNDLGDALKDTKGYTSENDWWEKWKGTAASILGLAAGSATFAFSLQASAKGLLFRYTAQTLGAKHVIQFGAAAVKFSALTTAGGAAIAVGCASAVAVYFIPWERFFGWLGGVFAWICQACSRVWDWFTSWFTEFKEWLKEKFPNLQKPMTF